MEQSDPAMYIFLNKGLGMTVGKAAAMAAHAATEAVLGSNEALVKQWRYGGHYKKLVMSAENEENLSRIAQYIEDRGFKVFRIIDEGLTEVDPMTFVALGVEVVDKTDPHTAKTFQIFQLYRDTIRVTLEINR